MMKTWQRNLIALIFIISIDTRIHAIQVFHVFQINLQIYKKWEKQNYKFSLIYMIWLLYFKTTKRSYLKLFYVLVINDNYMFSFKRIQKKIRVPKFLESLIKLKIKIIKNGYTSWSLSKQFSKLNDAQGLHLAWGLNHPIWTIWQTK